MKDLIETLKQIDNDYYRGVYTMGDRYDSFLRDRDYKEAMMSDDNKMIGRLALKLQELTPTLSWNEAMARAKKVWEDQQEGRVLKSDEPLED